MQSSHSKQARNTWRFRQFAAALAALFGSLHTNAARADWGEDWGEMMWGFGATAVPMLDGWSLLLLPTALVALALISIAKGRGPRITLLIFVALAVPLTAYAATITMPHVFVNGTPADADEINANFDTLVLELNSREGRILTLESGGGHTHSGADITSQVGDADTVDGVHAIALEESLEIDADIATHATDASAHHTRYDDTNAVSAILAADGMNSMLDADLIDGMEASQIIDAASDEVRTAISRLPFSITTSGSYYVTANLNGSSGGIDILASDVTLDLMGFSLDGAGVKDHGIDLDGRSGVTIRNGKIRGFAFAGIYQNTTTGHFNQVFNVQVLDNGAAGTTSRHSGIYLAGSFNHVEHCTAGNNGGYGIFAGAGSSLTNNTGEGISPSGCPSVPPGCPASHAQRLSGTVITELRTSLAAQDWAAVACNYSVDAFNTNDQGVLTGHSDIIAAEQSLSEAFNGIPSTLRQQDSFQDTVRVLDFIDGGWIVIPDRVTTYVVECGIISRQTDHGLIEFTGPPPS